MRRAAHHPLATMLRLLAGVILAASLTPGNAHGVFATSIVVSTTADELNNDGDCALREAVRAANLNRRVDACPAGRRGLDVITLPPGTFILTIPGADENSAARGDLDLWGRTTIEGAGAGVTIIDGNLLDRVLDIRSGADATVRGVTIRNGGYRRSTPGNGGGIRNSGTLTIAGSTIKGNRADAGGGGGISNDGRLTIVGSTIGDNYASFGGGIRNSARLALGRTTISGNRAYAKGGGIYNVGTLTIEGRSVIRENRLDGPDDAKGGGIYSRAALTITDSTVRGNSGAQGGGIFNDAGGSAKLTRAWVNANQSNGRPESRGAGIANIGSLAMTRSTVAENTATAGLGRGGGLYNTGSATVTHSFFLNNIATYETPVDNPYEARAMGGGIFNQGTITLGESAVSGNAARLFDDDQFINGGDGGGINNKGEMTIARTVVATNTSTIGGGIANHGAMTVNNSVVRNNRSDGAAGISNSGLLAMDFSAVRDNIAGDYSGGIGNDGQITLANGTISGNRGYNGGALANFGLATLINMTVSGNVVFDVAPGILNQGDNSTLTIASSTIVGNRNWYADDGIAGAGLDNQGSSVFLRNSILGAGPGNITGGDCEGTIISQGYNLIQSPGSCGLTGSAAGDQTNMDPQLGPLQHNGGPTSTHALGAGSPAIDSGNPAAPGSAESACPSIDQRGYPRPRDGSGDGKARCDIGAFELQGSTRFAYTWGESDIENAPGPQGEPGADAPHAWGAPGTEPSAGEDAPAEDALPFRVLLPFVGFHS